MEILGAVIGSILSCTCNNMSASLEEKRKYIKSSKEEVRSLRDRKQELIAQIQDVKAKLLIAEGEGKTRTRNVDNWLHKASGVISQVDLVQPEAEARKGCWSRAKLGKQMLKLIEEMTNLLNAGQFSEEALAFFVQERGMQMATTRLIGKTTAEKNLEMVWECLVGDEFQKIGVYGMGGVGKTTLMMNINNRLMQQSRFNNVLWVTVSRSVDAQKLQEQIAKVVNLDLFDEHDEARRSSLLLSALCRKGKFVLILDDMWESFDLLKLGVPEPTKDNGCKIVLTTRSVEVCGGMLCQKEVIVERLSEDEAWELFLANVDEELVPEVEEIAKEIVAECCGLPLAIITIGRAMSRKDKIEWRVALTDLQESTSLNMDMEEKVIHRLKFSYDQLRENHQKCFLYCALYPEDRDIYTTGLIEYWVMEGLVKGRNKEEEILRCHVILNTLKRCCLLEESSYGEGDVKMHDLIRDMALYITKSNPKFMVRAGYLFEEVPHEDDWSEDLERVSFMASGIENISIIPKCPKLSTLILTISTRLRHIPPGFFMHMKSLTVLDLSWTGIESLPDSASDLVNLRGLLLFPCFKLVRVPCLSKLQSLRVLKLTYSAIEELPRGMEMLVNLRCLDLSYNSKLKEMIPSGLISKFSLLQELRLRGITVEIGGDFVQELSSLTHLENLEIQFHELSDFIAYGELGNFEMLKKFVIVIGDIHPASYAHERMLCLSNSKGIPCNALSLPKHTQFFGVEDFNEITRLSELLLNDLMDLREFQISSCNSIEFIVPEDEESIFLQRIEKMHIDSCHNLSKIYEKVPTHGAFPGLKMLRIWNCGNIKILLSSRFLQQLPNLEIIDVHGCKQLEELVIADEEESGEGSSSTVHNKTFVVLPRLNELKLKDLPKLNSIWKGVMVCVSLQTVEVFNCPELKRLPLFNEEHQSAPPSLKTIKGSREWWDSLEWDYPCPEHLLSYYDDEDEDEDEDEEEEEVDEEV